MKNDSMRSRIIMELERTFEPITIRNMIVPNRVAMAAHETRFANGPVITDALVAYHTERAKGGVGLIILEAATVHPSSTVSNNPSCLAAYDDRIIEGYQRLMAAVRPHGTRVFQQLWHGGHHFGPGDGRPPRGVSAVTSPIIGVPPVPLDREDIAELVAAYAGAARRVVAGGLDGVEIAAAHSYLIQQFLSPMTNTRDDEYGGSLENRSRFLVEVLRAVRDAVGTDMPVGVRVGAGAGDGAVREFELSEVANRLVDDGLIDFLNVSQGDFFGPHIAIGGMENGAGYQLPSSGQITAAVTRVPRLVTGRFRALDEVEEVLRSGAADMVSMVRAHIAAPDIVEKTRTGRLSEIRPCIGCNQGCLGVISGIDSRTGCVVNPVVGFEDLLSEGQIGRTTNPRNVVVVGGGPAGLEAARTAAMRGHEVVLYEAAPYLGGALNLARRAPNLSGIFDVVTWQVAELDRLGVVVRKSSPVDVEGMLRLEADSVIVATGSIPDKSGVLISAPGRHVAGVGEPHVVSSVELLGDGKRDLGQTAVVYDDVGHYESVAVVEYLLDRGLDVTVVTRFPSFAPVADRTLRTAPARSRYIESGRCFDVRPHALLTRILPDSCFVQSFGSADEELAADTVVLLTHRLACDDLSVGLRAAGKEVIRVGDALSPRDLQTAIREGHLAGRGVA
ncbi:FAD-dependent oxidoreductase [Streptomyces sp. NPDC004629]|uniref:oxidoreductase n=1 Tax=Streptomyces sp. NPDC004629 TaxID=3364705 RepID=UPI003675FBA9